MPESPIFKMIKDGVPTKELESFIKNNPKDINARNECGHTPAYLAVYYDRPEAFKILAKNNANLDFTDKHGKTIAHWAAHHGHSEVLQILAENNVNLNTKNSYGTTPLHEAVIFENLEALHILAQNKADLDAKDNGGVAPINDADNRGNKEIVSWLSFYGAEVYIKRCIMAAQIGKRARKLVDTKEAFLMGLASNYSRRLPPEKQNTAIRKSFLNNEIFDKNVIKPIFDFTFHHIKLKNYYYRGYKITDIEQMAIEMARDYFKFKRENIKHPQENKEEKSSDSLNSNQPNKKLKDSSAKELLPSVMKRVPNGYT